MIEKEKWYSISELVALAKEGYLPFKGRQTWVELIKAGKLKAVSKGNAERKAYTVHGTDVLALVESLKNGDQVSSDKA